MVVITIHYHFYTSAALSIVSVHKQQAHLTKQKNLIKQEELQKKAITVQLHIILGTIAYCSGDADTDPKWASCNLAHTLV
jgi:hypothetical protein